MKLTDDKRAELVEWTKICGGFRMPDMVVELLESEQAAWQEVDRLREENERLNNEMDSILTLLEDRNPTAHELLISKHHKIIDLEKENELLKDKSDQAFRIMLSATSDNE